MPQDQDSATGTLTGRVTSNEAPLPGATITATSPQSGSRTTTSDENGNYNIMPLVPAGYSVRIEFQGMQTVTRPALVTAGGTARVDADLELAQA
jgi:hypothetical protein